jgi:hypothetical protein
MKNLQRIWLLGSVLISLASLPLAQAGVELSVGVVIKSAPPAPRQEVIVERPSPRHIWVPGYWHWEGHRHVWVAGCWTLPPRERVVYAPAHWDHRSDGYVFVAGQWCDASTAPAVTATTTPTEIIVSQAPPPPPAEQIGSRPFAEAVWVSGYWTWGNGAFVWTSGSWIKPPTPGSAYVAPHWEARDAGFAFCSGYWQPGVAQASTPAPVYVSEPPPPVMHEVIVARPSRHHVWIAGHWYWQGGRYVWAAGRWEIPPRPHSSYVAAHWEYRGHGYVLIEGHWR